MFDSFLAVPLHFTVEFVGFLVAAGGAIMALTRRTLVPGEVSNRMTAALGFGVLAAAHVAHGGAFAAELEADGFQLLVAGRALAFALILIGVMGGIRAGAAALAPFTVTEPLLFAPAGAAAILAAAAFHGSLGSGPRSLRRLAGASLLLGISEVLTAAAPNQQFGAESVSEYAFAAHVVKLLGYIVMTFWLWSAVRSSVRARFVASFAALLVAVVLALSSSLTGVLSNSVEEEKLRTLGTQLEDIVRDFGAQTRDLAAETASVGNLDTVRETVAQGGNLNPLAEEIMRDLNEFFEFDFVMLTDPRGGLLGFEQGRPQNEKDPKLRQLEIVGLNGSKVVAEVVDGSPASASPIRVGGRLVTLIAARRVAHPTEPSRTAGIISMGRFVDQRDMSAIKGRTAADASLIFGSRAVASTLDTAARTQKLVPSGVKSQVSQIDDIVPRRHVLSGTIYFSTFAMLKSPGGEPVAMLMLSSKAEAIGGTREALTRILFLVAMAVGAVALVLAWFSGRRITKPIQMLTEAANAVRQGDLSAQAPVSGSDEVGRLGETFNEMTSSMFRLTNDLRTAAREEYQLRARIETIMQSMADGLVAADPERKIVAFNREAELITGIKARHALGKDVSEVLDARDSQDDKVNLPIFDLAQGSLDNVFIARKNGERVPVTMVSAVLLGEEGDVTGGVAVLRDMTREREVERMKTEFLSNISHELRTPLTPIKGYAEILTRKEVPPDKAQKFAGGILESTARLERIVELLVDFSAMEAGRMAPRSQPIDIGEILEELGKQWGERSPNHEVVTNIEGSLPKVAGDERLLKRTLHEVLDNAVKFSPHGGTIRLAARGAGANNGERRHRAVEVIISDEGIGIPPQDVPKIFSDFHQLDGSETRTYGGLGLGLAFVQRIVEAHEGSISVESEPQVGTAFTIRLPAAKRSKSAPKPKAVEESAAASGQT